MNKKQLHIMARKSDVNLIGDYVLFKQNDITQLWFSLFFIHHYLILVVTLFYILYDDIGVIIIYTNIWDIYS